jgi:hypothetical protein
MEREKNSLLLWHEERKEDDNKKIGKKAHAHP